MKLYTTILILTFTTQFVFAQNLVPNPSFEDTVFCPYNVSQINMSSGWMSFSDGTPDYYNKCSNNILISVPNNSDGFQYPSSIGCGAYAGIGVYFPFYGFNREYIGIQLSTNLNVGQKYYISFKTSLANSSKYAINKLGGLFTTTKINILSNSNINNAHIVSEFIISDTANWVVISGSLIADSLYKYFLIGNLFDNSFLNVDSNDELGTYAYYYIDDVCVSTDSLTCNQFILSCNTDISEIDKNESITILPNPFFDKTIVQINSIENFKSALICIYDIFGRIMQNIKTTHNKIEISRNNLPAGIYFFTVSFNNNIFKQKIVITD